MFKNNASPQLLVIVLSSLQVFALKINQEATEGPSAICITGQMRSGYRKDIIDSHIDNMLKHFDSNADVFAYVNGKDDDPSPHYDHHPAVRFESEDPFLYFKQRWGKNLVNFKEYNAEDLVTPPNGCDRNKSWPQDGLRGYKQWLTWKNCYDLITDHEASTGKQYSVIAKIRPDILFKAPIALSAETVRSSEPAVYGWQMNPHFLHDKVLVSHRDFADTLFHTLQTYFKCWDEDKMTKVKEEAQYMCPGRRKHKIHCDLEQALIHNEHFFLMDYLNENAVKIRNVPELEHNIHLVRPDEEE